jgi:hypothetical protein
MVKRGRTGRSSCGEWKHKTDMEVPKCWGDPQIIHLNRIFHGFPLQAIHCGVLSPHVGKPTNIDMLPSQWMVGGANHPLCFGWLRPI